MIGRLCTRQAIVGYLCILYYASCVFSEVEAISPFFFHIFLSFFREIKFLSSPVRDVLILKSWGGERSRHSEYRYLLCSSPQPVRLMELAVAALRDLPPFLQRAGATREEKMCKLQWVKKHNSRRQKAWTERCRGWGSAWGMTFNKVSPISSYRLEKMAWRWVQLECV